MENFEVVREDKAQISLLRIKGFLDAHTAPKFEDAIQDLVSESRNKIVVSMTDLNYISSAGLGVFMGFIEEIREKSGDIKLCCMSPKVFKVFDLLGFPALYEIYDNENDAIQKFNN